MREVVHIPGNVLRLVQRVADKRFGRAWHFVEQELEIHREQGDLLADIVVQFAGEARTFGVLGLEQPRPEIADALVAAAQLLVAATHVLLCLPSHPSLQQQRRR